MKFKLPGKLLYTFLIMLATLLSWAQTFVGAPSLEPVVLDTPISRGLSLLRLRGAGVI
jgi:hypothetical protein